MSEMEWVRSPIWDPYPYAATEGVADPVLTQEALDDVLFWVLLCEIACGRADELGRDPLYDDLGGES